jgi:serine/threonine-protein kinase
VELTPDNAAAWINLGAGYERLEKPAEAESAYRKSIALSPSYAAYANLGNIYANQRNYAAAIQAREKALELNDKDFRVWVNLGNAYRALHNDAKARAAYLRALPLNEQAAKIQSRNPDPQSGLALVYAKLGMRDQGLAAIRTALALAPDATITMLRAMETYEILGERKQALDWAARYLQKGGSADELRQNPDLRQLVADPKFKFPGH